MPRTYGVDKNLLVATNGDNLCVSVISFKDSDQVVLMYLLPSKSDLNGVMTLVCNDRSDALMIINKLLHEWRPDIYNEKSFNEVLSAEILHYGNDGRSLRLDSELVRLENGLALTRLWMR
jgi:hypothetical protein